MNSYGTLQARYARLRLEIEREMRAESERAAIFVAERVREVLKEFGFDMVVWPRSQHLPIATQKKGIVPKYRDPKTGRTWSGRGRAPGWIAGKDRELYLIETVHDADATRYVPEERGSQVGSTNT
ncbi:H-NS family nucleoid-associated regulatory protein [Burkholderia orbicola]|uniref:H-NS histone family protein n=1 Tax=Burkholderia orbicola TaxID=2978683 RepID=UPI003AF9720E